MNHGLQQKRSKIKKEQIFYREQMERMVTLEDQDCLDWREKEAILDRLEALVGFSNKVKTILKSNEITHK